VASTAIINCSLLDVRSGSVLPNRSIFVENGRVERVAPSGTLPPLEETIDARGAFVIPGLIDMHVHACASPGRTEVRGHAPARIGIAAAANLRVALGAGITTVRDLGGGPVVPYELASAWAEREFAGSRPLVAGPMLTAVGGHGSESGADWATEVCGEEEMRRAVRTAVSCGSDVIKVVTGGVGTRTELTRAELRTAVEEAHWNGVKVASHANFGLRGIRNSIVAGCDSIEHGCAADRAALEEMAERGIVLCPTITVLARVNSRSDIYGRRTPALTKAVERAWLQHEETVGRAIELGVAIVAGTDAGLPAVGFDALLEELEWLVRWGMSPLDALRAATCKAADALGRDDLGDLSPGCAADLLLLEGNPAEDVANLRKAKGVMLGGRLVRRAPSLKPAAPGAH
jgi:imidazolonepropionase-like amidohydrolase